ncbi:hypothetical protein Scep_015140 [Stephania cephalantha]|uniref:Uncharacterized protein n=1 Tax=Stephania cephalantha TaxID=152367 RepID=A0AAP0P166_9MAGN
MVELKKSLIIVAITRGGDCVPLRLEKEGMKSIRSRDLICSYLEDDSSYFLLTNAPIKELRFIPL